MVPGLLLPSGPNSRANSRRTSPARPASINDYRALPQGAVIQITVAMPGPGTRRAVQIVRANGTQENASFCSIYRLSSNPLDGPQGTQIERIEVPANYVILIKHEGDMTLGPGASSSVSEVRKFHSRPGQYWCEIDSDSDTE
jgi:hypothetical protein